MDDKGYGRESGGKHVAALGGVVWGSPGVSPSFNLIERREWPRGPAGWASRCGLLDREDKIDKVGL